jgi:hypothetical protein
MNVLQHPTNHVSGLANLSALIAVINKLNQQITQAKEQVEVMRAYVTTLEREVNLVEVDRYKSRLHRLEIERELAKMDEVDRNLSMYHNEKTKHLHDLLRESLALLDNLEESRSVN